MRNVWIICQKELRSYFVSPIAYLLLAMFAIVFGFFFWNAVGYFIYAGMEAQMRGEHVPAERERTGDSPAGFQRRRDRALSYSDDHDAVVRGRKAQRHDRAAGYVADPRFRGHPGQMARGVVAVCRDVVADGAELRVALPLRQPGLETAGSRLSRPVAAGGRAVWR